MSIWVLIFLFSFLLCSVCDWVVMVISFVVIFGVMLFLCVIILILIVCGRKLKLIVLKCCWVDCFIFFVVFWYFGL